MIILKIVCSGGEALLRIPPHDHCHPFRVLRGSFALFLAHRDAPLGVPVGPAVG